MFKKTITYKDYNGVERTEDHYFNLTQAEIMEMEMEIPGGLTAMIKNIVAAQNTPEIIKIFKELILRAYGEKSADGRRFIKSPELTTAFTQTEAYSILFMELATNAEAGAEFVNEAVPEDLAKQVQERSQNTTPVISNPVSGNVMN